MLKKISNFFLEIIYSHVGTAFLVFAIMLLLSIFNLINTTLFLSTNGWLLPMIIIAFALPLIVFIKSRGGKRYLQSFSLKLPNKPHIPSIICSSFLIFFGSALLKLLFVNGKYTEFPLYSTFFAHRNGRFFNDIYLILAFCIVPPILEAFVFRGTILKELDKRGRLTATLCSSILFALLGFNMLELLPRLLIGCVLCMVFYATGSILLTTTIHIAYNIFAVFIEPTLVSIKNVSANFELFTFIVAIITLISAIFLFSNLSKLYQKYAHVKFGTNTTKSTSRARTIQFFSEFMLSIPAIACYVVFVVVSLLANK